MPPENPDAPRRDTGHSGNVAASGDSVGDPAPKNPPRDLASGVMTEYLTDDWGFFIRSARVLEKFRSAFQEESAFLGQLIADGVAGRSATS